MQATRREMTILMLIGACSVIAGFCVSVLLRDRNPNWTHWSDQSRLNVIGIEIRQHLEAHPEATVTEASAAVAKSYPAKSREGSLRDEYRVLINPHRDAWMAYGLRETGPEDNVMLIVRPDKNTGKQTRAILIKGTEWGINDNFDDQELLTVAVWLPQAVRWGHEDGH